MSVTEFPMVRELAFIIRDNLPSKHLILGVEDALVNFLEVEDSLEGALKLEPMDPYNRLLVHRLADIFGFAHESVGDEDDRRIVLVRCPETAKPSILVSEFLSMYDTIPVATHPQLLRRNVSCSGDAREPINLKPRNAPVVARRMIAHALGQRMSSERQNPATEVDGENERPIQGRNKIDLNSKVTILLPRRNAKSVGQSELDEANAGCYSAAPSSSSSSSLKMGAVRSRNQVKSFSKEQHVAAARRMFAHALGLPSVKGGCPSKPREVKQAGAECDLHGPCS